MTNHRPVRVGAVAAAAALTLAACTNSPPASSAAGDTARSTPSSATASGLEQQYVSVVAKVLPSIVQITNGHDLGSGIVFDTQGDIVTNAHVAAGATRFQVTLAGSPTPVPASLVGAYPPDDLAVIHLDTPPRSLSPATFGDSATLQVGDIVLAMGNPLGLSGSVSNGIVSATGRLVSEPTGGGSPGATLPDTIQTSAPINPGNSGGALVDLAGDVVGVPTLAAIDPQAGGGPNGSGAGGGSPAPGIGFAISSNLVKDIAGQLVAHGGHVVDSHRAELGVQAVTVIDQTGQPSGAGVVSVVAGGPAAAAGITAGEVITAVDNTPVHSSAELSNALAQLSPGQAVPVTVLDPQGASRTVTVTLGQLPGS